MKRSSGSRKIGKLSISVSQQLNAYALAASAAGVSLIALVQAAEAKIVYTKTNKVLYKWHDFASLDLNHDGIADFVLGIVHSTYPGSGGKLAAFKAHASTQNSVRGTSKRFWAAAYPAGVRIGSKKKAHYEGAPPKSSNRGALMEHGCGLSSTSVCRNSEPFGNWLDVENRYLGLAFQINGETHYGWARLSASVNAAGRLYAVLTGYAYETIPNKAIKAGQTKGADESTAEDFDPSASVTGSVLDKAQPATLGALAIGAPGLSVWRKKGAALESD